MEQRDKAEAAVFVQSQQMPKDATVIRGYDFNQGVDYHSILKSYESTGLQASNFGLAVKEIQKMLDKREESIPDEQQDSIEDDVFIKRRTSCTIFLGYTSNMISSGIRDTIRYLVEHRMVDCIVTTAGGVEEDIIKCLAPTYLGDFALKGKKLREKGINRIGNMLVPNDNYCKFEDWVMPILDKLVEEQQTNVLRSPRLKLVTFRNELRKNPKSPSWGEMHTEALLVRNVTNFLFAGTVWSPSKVIARLGEEINDKTSVLYWAAKNHIPIFSPALTDGSLGDMIYFHTYKNPGLVIDIVQDIRRINSMATKAISSGMIIIGGSVIKHHICNANLMRNGADHAVFINTGNEFDGSDSGARPDEAISWGKIKKDASPVKIYADASLVFPLLVAETFARHISSSK